MTRDDFAAGFRQLGGKVRIESSQEIKDFHAAGEVAYTWSHISVAMTSLETGAKTERSGHVLTVFRKSLSGGWLLARDANLMAGPQSTGG
jgi:ketosteroid isomerase-like protein